MTWVTWVLVAVVWVVFGGSAVSLMAVAAQLLFTHPTMDVRVFALLMLVGAGSSAMMLSLFHRMLRSHLEWPS